MGVWLMGNIASTANRNPPTPSAPQAALSGSSLHKTPSSPLASANAQKRPLPPVDYPAIDVWLQSLENDPERSKKSHGFGAFSNYFVNHGIDDLEDFLRLTNSEILRIVPNINIGIANRLLAFAQEDHSLLQQRKRIHIEHIQY